MKLKTIVIFLCSFQGDKTIKMNLFYFFKWTPDFILNFLNSLNLLLAAYFSEEEANPSPLSHVINVQNAPQVSNIDLI